MTRRPPPRRGWDDAWASDWIARLLRAAQEEAHQGIRGGAMTAREHLYWTAVISSLTAALAFARAARKWAAGEAKVEETDVDQLAKVIEATADASQAEGEDPYTPIQELLFGRRGGDR